MPNDKDDYLNVPPIETMIPIQSGTDTSSDAIDKVLAQANNLSGNILHEPTCVICSNPHREEIEQKWIETKKHADVKKLIKGRSDIEVTNGIIDNHMLYHNGREVREHVKQEYRELIRRLNSVELTTLDRIRLGLSAVTERLIGINSLVPDTNNSVVDIEQIKSVETARLMSNFNQLIKLNATIMGEMHKKGEIISIPREAFISFYNDILAEAITDEEKKVIRKVLDGLLVLGQLLH